MPENYPASESISGAWKFYGLGSVNMSPYHIWQYYGSLVNRDAPNLCSTMPIVWILACAQYNAPFCVNKIIYFNKIEPVYY